MKLRVITYFLTIFILLLSNYADCSEQIRSDVLNRRQMAIDFIFGDYSPATLSIVENYRDIQTAIALNMLNRTDKYTVHMDFGITSTVYHYYPQNRINKLIMYHHGHYSDMQQHLYIVSFFLNRGYDVIVFAMPLVSPNPTLIVVNIEPFGEIQIRYHDTMMFLELLNRCPLKYFLEPVGTVLNYVLARNYYSQIAMIGLSGGACITTLYSALDTRIDNSYPVAGSLPLRFRQWDWGDMESYYPRFYQMITYEELYLLACSGGRRQLQILNLWDPCCFQPPHRYQELVVDYVNEKLIDINDAGRFGLHIDMTHNEHEISDSALYIIEADLESYP